MEVALNLLIMGKTGTGKSSLINYICKSKVANVAAGKICTLDNLVAYDFEVNSSKISVYDTYPIDLTASVENDILNEFTKSKKKAIFDIVLYCFNSSEKIISAKELEKIIDIRRKYKNIIFVQTCDDMFEEKNNHIINKVKEMGFTKNEFIKVSSEEKIYISGKNGSSYGKDEIFKAIRFKIADKMFKQISDEFEINLYRRLTMWSLRCKNELNQNKSLFAIKDNKKTEVELIEDFNKYLEEAKNALSEDIKMVFQKVYDFYEVLFSGELLERFKVLEKSAQICLPAKIKKTYNFAVIDKVSKQLEKFWRSEFKNEFKNFWGY